MKFEKSKLVYLMIQYKDYLNRRLYKINRGNISKFIHKNEIEFLTNEINEIYHALMLLDNVDLIRRYD